MLNQNQTVQSIIRAREFFGITQSQFAEPLSISRWTLARFDSGESTMTQPDFESALRVLIDHYGDAVKSGKQVPQWIADFLDAGAFFFFRATVSPKGGPNEGTGKNSEDGSSAKSDSAGAIQTI